MPSAPFFETYCTNLRACSGVSMAPPSHCRALVKMYGKSRGATISLRALRSRSWMHQSVPLPQPGSRTEVTPCAIHSLNTYSAVVPCSAPPEWPCMSTKPGCTHRPVPSISLVAFFGRLSSLIGTLGKPTLRISLMRLPSMTMSTGPTGGAPVDIVIEGNRIKEIRSVGFPKVPIKEDNRPKNATKEIDGTGLWVLPGFVDMHGHSRGAA